MQRLVTRISSMFFLAWPFEPSVENLKVQIIIEETRPCLYTAKCILLAITRALTRYRYYKDMTGTLAENAAITTVRISKFVEAAEGSPQNFDRIAQLEKILHNIHKFVQSETQSKFYSGENLISKFVRFNDCLTALLGSFEQTVSRLPVASEDEVVSPSTGLSRPEDILTMHRPSMFSGAHNFVVTGGAYYNISGNYVNVAESKDEESSRKFKGIVEGSRVVTDEEVSADRQIQKGNGYRLYSAQSSGRIVAMKVYTGKSSKERCREAAKFYQKVIHPNIPHMIGVSSLKSERSFLIFHGEYQGTVDYMLVQALKDGLQQSLVLGLKTVAGLSSGLDYLHDLDYPLVSAGLDHLVLLSCGGKLTITFDPEDLGQINQSNRHLASADKALELFHGLCRKTFDAARKSHYESLDVYSDERDSDTDDPLDIDGETHIPAANVPLDVSISSPTVSSISLASPAPPSGLPRKSPRNGRRQELVWKPQTAENLTLDDISRQFQDFLTTQPSPSESAFNRRRGRRSRQTARSAHRCRGYNRIEITLTSDVMRSAIVFNSTPTPHEICSVCKEVVKDAEIFNCLCGNDDESMPTVKCYICSEWHHQLCTNFFASEDQRFVCTSCKEATNGSGSQTLFTAGANETPDRLPSSSMRFVLQLIIYPEDVPDNMQFDPNTEAIVLKNALADPDAPITVAPRFRRTVFVFPITVTVAEVVELGLERFGILVGVVEGGDEVEEKTTRKGSEQQVRYGLTVKKDGQESYLGVSSMIIDAFPGPPQLWDADLLNTRARRRSFHGSDPFGLVNDIRSDDPVFILRRATPYRTSSPYYNYPVDVSPSTPQNGSSYNLKLPTTLPGVKQWLSKNSKKKAATPPGTAPGTVSFSPLPVMDFQTSPITNKKPSISDIFGRKANEIGDWERILSHQNSDTQLSTKYRADTPLGQPSSPYYPVEVSPSTPQNGSSYNLKLPTTLPGVKQWLSKNSKKKAATPPGTAPGTVSFSPLPVMDFQTSPITNKKPSISDIFGRKVNDMGDWEDIGTTHPSANGDSVMSQNSTKSTANGLPLNGSNATESNTTENGQTSKAHNLLPLDLTAGRGSPYKFPSSPVSDYPSPTSSESSSTASSQYSLEIHQGPVVLERLEEN